MAIEIASLVARISFEAQRASQVISDAERVAQAVQGVGLAGELAAQKLRIGNAELANLANKAAESGAAVRKAQADFAAFGMTEDQVAAGAKKLASEITALSGEQLKLVEQQILLSDQIRAYAADLEVGEQKTVEHAQAEAKLAEVTRLLTENEKKLADVQGGANKRTIEAIQAQQQLNAVRKAGVGDAKNLNQAMERQARETQRVAAANRAATAAGGGRAGVTRSELTSLFSMLMSGRLNASALTQILFRLGQSMSAVGAQGAVGAKGVALMLARMGALAAVALPLVAVVGGVAAAFAILNSETGKLAQQANLLDPKLRALADSLTEIKNVGPISLAGALGGVRNQASAQGFNDPGAAASQIASAANTLQYLNQVPDDFQQALDAATRFATRLDVQGLIEYGVNVQDLTRYIEELKSRGFDDATVAQEAWARATAQMNARNAEATEQARREAEGFGGLVTQFKVWQEITADTKLAEPIKEFTAALRELLPTAQGAFGDMLAWVVDFGTTAVRWFGNAIDAVYDFQIELQKIDVAFQENAGGIINFLNSSFSGAGELLRATGFGTPAGLEESRAALRTLQEEIDLRKERREELEHPITIPDLAGRLDGQARSFEGARDQMKAYTDQGDSLVAGMQSLASAWETMEADLNPANAIAALSQFNKVLDMVIFQGIESIELLKLRAQAAFAAGFITQAQLNAAVEGYDAVAAAVAPIAAEAEIMKEKLREAANNAGPAVLGLGGDIQTMGGQAVAAANQVGTLTSAIATAQSQAARGIHLNISSSGGFSTNLPFTPTGTTTTRTPRAPGGPPVRHTMEDAQANRNVNKQILAAEALRAAADKMQRAPVTTPLDWSKLIGAVPRAGGGGGGGGGGKSAEDEFAASLEQIRALMRAVNEAIAIGIRGGVRIGTEGNLVPFEPGTFLNAQGNQLTVDTIVIRGVWDFADPATRRQIVKELKQALRELEDEL